MEINGWICRKGNQRMDMLQHCELIKSRVWWLILARLLKKHARAWETHIINSKVVHPKRSHPWSMILATFCNIIPSWYGCYYSLTGSGWVRHQSKPSWDICNHRWSTIFQNARESFPYRKATPRNPGLQLDFSFILESHLRWFTSRRMALVLDLVGWVVYTYTYVWVLYGFKMA